MTYTNKTQPTTVAPIVYLAKNFAKDERIQTEAHTLIDLYTQITGSSCVMWNKIFGFGKYYYHDSKGGEHSYLMTGFVISKTGFTLYNLMCWENYKQELEKLGKFKISGKSCLAIKSVADINLKVLKFVTKKSIADIKKKYKTEK